MGYDLMRFTEEVNEEFVCTICWGVLEDPVQVSRCEHLFCRSCINEWRRRNTKCPVDQTQPIEPEQLRPVPRILRNLLSKLSISCNHSTYGCTAVLNLDSLPSHLADCEYNPKRPTHCEKGCGLVIPKDELARHNCVRELQAWLGTQQARLAEFQEELAEQRRVLELFNGRYEYIGIRGFTEMIGIDISSHRDGHIFITGIKQGSVAAKHRIKLGDIIVDIDGDSVFGKEHSDSEVAESIKQSLGKGKPLSIKLQRCVNTEYTTWENELLRRWVEPAFSV